MSEVRAEREKKAASSASSRYGEDSNWQAKRALSMAVNMDTARYWEDGKGLNIRAPISLKPLTREQQRSYAMFKWPPEMPASHLECSDLVIAVAGIIHVPVVEHVKPATQNRECYRRPQRDNYKDA